LGSIAVPTLVVVGERDAITPVDGAKKMAERIPGAELTVVGGAGHMSPVEEPDVVNRAVGSFLEDLRKENASS